MKNLGLLELDCTVVKIKDVVLNITSPYGNNCSDDDVNAEVIQAEVDGTAETTLVDEDSEGIDEAEVDSNSDGSLFDDNKEVKGVVDSSDDDIKLDTVKSTNYIQQHEYKKLFEYAVAIYKADPRAISKVSCDAVSISDKSKYGGVLLAAVGIDGNNEIVPLAICLKQLFWKAIKSCNKYDFEKAMAEIKAVKEAAFE
ncbi:hypothetical protein WN943_001409 [Citrus x changshan-huyou]